MPLTALLVELKAWIPFGEQLAAAPGAPNEKYAGLLRDDETGLDYAQARQYSTRAGRFSGPDPVYSGPPVPIIRETTSRGRLV